MQRELSRRKLYALGEPIGDSATRIEGGRRIYGGGGGGGKASNTSSSSASTTSTETTTNTQTWNTDKRQVVDGGIGVTSDSSNVYVTTNTLDAGAIDRAFASVDNAMAGMIAADATNGEGFDRLLNLAEMLFSGAGDIIERTQQTTLEQISQVQTAQQNASEFLTTAQNDSRGAIDQKTILILAGAGVALAALHRLKGKS